MKIIRRLFYFISLLLLLGFALLYFVAPYAIMQPGRNICDAVTGVYPAIESVQVKTSDGVLLDGYWHHVDTPRATILLLHGVGGCKEGWRPTSQWLASLGIETIAMDSRGHGRSGGKFVTFGYYEKHDVQAVLDFIDASRDSLAARSLSSAVNQKPTQPIGIFGNSLGGAIALQAMAIDERIDFGIIESTFAHLDEVIFEYMKRPLRGYGFRFMSDFALWRAGKIAGFDPNDVRPSTAAKLVKQPVFHAHGDADIHIPVRDAKVIFEQFSSSDSELVIVPGADHSGLYTAGGEAYKQQMINFIERQLEK